MFVRTRGDAREAPALPARHVLVPVVLMAVVTCVPHVRLCAFARPLTSPLRGPRAVLLVLRAGAEHSLGGDAVDRQHTDAQPCRCSETGRPGQRPDGACSRRSSDVRRVPAWFLLRGAGREGDRTRNGGVGVSVPEAPAYDGPTSLSRPPAIGPAEDEPPQHRCPAGHPRRRGRSTAATTRASAPTSPAAAPCSSLLLLLWITTRFNRDR